VSIPAFLMAENHVEMLNFGMPGVHWMPQNE